MPRACCPAYGGRTCNGQPLWCGFTLSHVIWHNASAWSENARELCALQSEKSRLDKARQQWEAARRQRRRHRQDAARAKRRAAEARQREQDILDEAMGRRVPSFHMHALSG